MALEGDLSLFRLPDVLQVVSHQQKTGILTVQGKSDILAVSFLEGRIVAADALNQSFDDLLGDVLDQRGIVARERFDELAEEQRSSRERMVDFLVESGALGREEMLESLRDLTYRLLLEVLGWREGQFKFYSGEEVAFEEGIQPLTVDQVLMRALGDLADEPGRSASIPHGYLAYLPVVEGRTVRTIPPDFDESTPLDPAIAWLTPDERAVLDRLDGRTSSEELAGLTGLGEDRVFYALYRLLAAGLARPAAGSRSEVEPERRAAPPRAARVEAPRVDELRIERSIVEAADLVPEATHPVAETLARGARFLPLALAVVLAVIVSRSPAPVLFPVVASDAQRAAYERLRRLERFGSIDLAARTFHLLEGRYPVGLEELASRGLLERHAFLDPRGAALALRSEVDTYQIVVARESETSPAVREGVFGDFLLDHRLFEGLEEETAVPLVLLD